MDVLACSSACSEAKNTWRACTTSAGIGSKVADLSMQGHGVNA